MKNFKLTKIIASSLIAVSILALNPVGASAEWKHDNIGWWYTEGNSWATGWRKIDGKIYYFYSNGYMAHDAEIDGFSLGADGAQITGIVSFKAPSNWTKVFYNGMDGYLLDNKGTNAYLISQDMQGYSEEDYVKIGISKLKSNLGINNIEISEEMFNGKKGTVIHYSTKINNRNTSIYQVLFVNNDTAYIFTLWGYENDSEENLSAFKNALNTVKFVN
jgi:hypothetical protein